MDIKVLKLSDEELEEKGVFDWPIWEKEVSEFPWTYDRNEDCYLLEGKVVIEYGDGKQITIEKGDFVSFPKDMECKWKVLEPVRKHYTFY